MHRHMNIKRNPLFPITLLTYLFASACSMGYTTGDEPVTFAGQAATSMCTDTPPDNNFSCAEQAGWGKCNESWMQGFCNQSCGRCAPEAPSTLIFKYPLVAFDSFSVDRSGDSNKRITSTKMGKFAGANKDQVGLFVKEEYASLSGDSTYTSTEEYILNLENGDITYEHTTGGTSPWRDSGTVTFPGRGGDLDKYSSRLGSLAYVAGALAATEQEQVLTYLSKARTEVKGVGRAHATPELADITLEAYEQPFEVQSGSPTSPSRLSVRISNDETLRGYIICRTSGSDGREPKDYFWNLTSWNIQVNTQVQGGSSEQSIGIRAPRNGGDQATWDSALAQIARIVDAVRAGNVNPPSFNTPPAYQLAELSSYIKLAQLWGKPVSVPMFYKYPLTAYEGTEYYANDDGGTHHPGGYAAELGRNNEGHLTLKTKRYGTYGLNAKRADLDLETGEIAVVATNNDSPTPTAAFNLRAPRNGGDKQTYLEALESMLERIGHISAPEVSTAKSYVENVKAEVSR